MNSSTVLEQYVTMREYLEGRRCIITGSSGTIGKIFATFIASRGGIPILVDVVPQDDTVEAVASYGGEYSAHRVDLSDVAQIKSLYAEVADQYDGVDMLINNAGILSEVKLLDMTEDNWDRVLNVNAKGAAFMSQGAVGLMQDSSGDRQIINIVSLAALVGRAVRGGTLCLQQGGPARSQPQLCGASREGIRDPRQFHQPGHCQRPDDFQYAARSH